MGYTHNAKVEGRVEPGNWETSLFSGPQIHLGEPEKIQVTRQPL